VNDALWLNLRLRGSTALLITSNRARGSLELVTVHARNHNQKAELWQRWPRDAPYIWCPENFRESLSTPTATYPDMFNGLLFRSVLWMFVQNLKFVALPLPEIARGAQKIWAVPAYAHASFSPKFWMDDCGDDGRWWKDEWRWMKDELKDG